MKILSSKEFARLVKPVLKAHGSDLERTRLKAKRFGQDSDWPWNGFISAFATNGRADHREKIQWHRYTWNALSELPDEKRQKRLTFATNPRRRTKHSQPWYTAYLEEAFQRFKDSGGPEGIRRAYRRLRSAEERIVVLMKFRGIGQKYARDIPMSAYDPKFLDRFVALDARLISLLKACGRNEDNYSSGEAFYQDVANHLGINCWSLDRILFKHYKQIRNEIYKSRKLPMTQRAVAGPRHCRAQSQRAGARA